MNKPALIITTLLFVALCCFPSCDGKDKPNVPKGQKVEMMHSFKITTSAPVQVLFSPASGLDNIFYNGADMGSWSIQKEFVQENGEKVYIFSTKSITLVTDVTFRLQQAVEYAKVTCEWHATIEGKQVDSGRETIELDKAHHSNGYKLRTIKTSNV